jgi:hypothetical protein
MLASFATPSMAQAQAQTATAAAPVAQASVAQASVSQASVSLPRTTPANNAVTLQRPAAPSISPGFFVPPAAVATPATPAVEQQRRPLRDLVISFVNYGDQDAEELCLAKAIYFEARSETLEGQLAVAEVILNRAASGLYPKTICEVVTQPAQFSFIRNGRFPTANTGSEGWRNALAIADIAQKGLIQKVARNVLWYHASYVAPSWGRRLTRFARIGTHIFYS